MEKTDEIAKTPQKYSYGVVDVETARIGIYNYHKAIEEQPEIKSVLKRKKSLRQLLGTSLVLSHPRQTIMTYVCY